MQKKVRFVKTPLLKISVFKTIYIDIKFILSDKAFKGTVVNQALPSLIGGSLKITYSDIILRR